MINAIACVFNTRTEFYIGHNNDLLFDIRTDKRFFKNYIKDKILICGYKTYKTLPKSIIESHTILVLTKNHYNEFDHNDRLHHFEFSYTNKTLVCQDINEILEITNKYKYKDFIVIGGGEIYKQFEPYITFWHITRVDNCSYDLLKLYDYNLVKMPFIPDKFEYNYTENELSSYLIEYDYKTTSIVKFIICSYYKECDVSQKHFEMQHVQKLINEYVR